MYRTLRLLAFTGLFGIVGLESIGYHLTPVRVFEPETLQAQQRAPILFTNLAVDSPIDEGDSTTLTGDLEDLIPGKSFLVLINWGDGSGIESLILPASATDFSADHTYRDDPPGDTTPNTFKIVVTVCNTNSNNGNGNGGGGNGNQDDNDEDCGNQISTGGTIDVTVNNVDPTVSGLTTKPKVNKGNLTTQLRGSVSDPGNPETGEILIEWGDGSSDTLKLRTRGKTVNFSKSHRYSGTGPFTITVTATDDDGGSDSDTIPAS
jgi:hypothetical protein